MEVVLSQFVKSLTKSGLMTSQQVEAFIEKLPPEKKPEDGKTLAQELVRHKKLTKFQAQAVYQGKTKGLTLGDYVVLDRIGQGGMGQVFKARHKVMKRVVALKTLPAAATNSERAVQRFHREVEVAARLSHPNIVTAYDAGESHGLHYLVMEHVDGDDLATVVKQRGRLTVKTVIDYILQAAKGLEYAHKQKVIHRDIKPSNLLLDREGTIKVLDMGLARLNQAMGPDQSEQETLTGTGQVMGTIDFMPPEQAENTKQADERSDIYSLGCTLYYLLTGEAIYHGDTTVMKILAHRETEIPSLRRELPEVSEQLDAIYQKMVAKKPDDRYGSMAEVIAELEKCASPPEEIPETATFEGITPRGKLAGDQTLDLNMPVISPVDEFRKARPKKAKKVKLEKKHIIFGSIAVGVLLILGLLGVVFSMQTPEGTLIVEVNQANAEISVDDGKVTLKSPSDSEPVEVEVAEGKHTLKITKGGFHTFAREFEITSGGEEVIRVTLVPLEKEVVAKPRPAPVSQPVAVSSSEGNWALEFDGTDDHVFVRGGRPIQAESPLTVECWLTFPSDPPSKHSVVFEYGNFCALRDSGQRHLSCQFKNETGGTLVGARDRRPGTTVHAALVYDNGDCRFFINGRPPMELFIWDDETQATIRAPHGSFWPDPNLDHADLFLGANNPKGDFYPFHGTIDEVRISNIARYTEDFTPQRRFEPDEHTMALYHFDEGSGDVLKDSSGNGHDGKIVGAKWVKIDEGVGVADAVADDPDRRAAEWVLGIGGKVVILEDGEERWISTAASIPQGDFTVIQCNLEDCTLVDDTGLLNLRGLTELRRLFLQHTSVGDKGLGNLGRQPNLQELSIAHTVVTDAGLEPLGRMQSLANLHLSDTAITDSGLEYLRGTNNLGRLAIIGTIITGEGLSSVPTLVAVSVNPNFLTEENIAALKRNGSIKLLAIQKPGDFDVQRLHQLKGLEYLFFLEGAEDSLTDAELVALRAALPDCVVRTEWDKYMAIVRELLEPDGPKLPHPPLAIAPFTPEEAEQHQQAWADYLGVPVEFTNSIGMKMVLIPPGEFMMGATDSDEDAEDDEKPQHKVRITKPYEIAACEVTVKQFRAFVGEVEYRTEAEKAGLDNNWQNPGFEQTDEHPVAWVSWNDTQAFCDWLGENEGRLYRLPTEAEWEFACRSGSTTRWFCGDTEAQLENFAWFARNGGDGTKPSGQKQANVWGLFDMCGNVWEWCSDQYASYDIQVINSRDRVLRGGAFDNPPCYLRSSDRRQFRASESGFNGGFRLARTTISGTKPIPSKPPAESAKPDPTPEPDPTSEMQAEEDEADNTPKISWKLRHTLEGHTDRVQSVAFHSKGQMVVSGSFDGTIRFWDVRAGKQLRFIQESSQQINDLAISPNGALVAAVGGSIKGVKIWNIMSGQAIDMPSMNDLPYGFMSIAFNPDGSAIACGKEDLWLHNLQTQQTAQLPSDDTGLYRSVDFSRNGMLLASGKTNGEVTIWSTKSGKPTVLLEGQQHEVGPPMCVAFSSDGARIIAGGHHWDHRLHVWDARTGELQKTFDEPGAVNAVATSPASPIVAIGGQQDESRIRLRDLETGEILAKLSGHEGQIRSLVFSRDGKLLVSGGDDKTVRIWEITVEQE